MLKNNGPGNACCCECTISPNFDAWISASGSWTKASTNLTWSAYTSSDNAELVSNKSWEFGWLVGSLRIIPGGPYCGWTRVGFRNEDGSNRIYVRYRRAPGTGLLFHHYLEIVEVDNSAETTLYSYEVESDQTVLAVLMVRDEDNDQFVVLTQINGYDPIRVSTTVSVDRMFVATETKAGFCPKVTFAEHWDMTSPGNLFRYCFNPTVHRAPVEFEVTITGVVQGTAPNGIYYDWFNDTFVLSLDGSTCQMTDPFVGWDGSPELWATFAFKDGKYYWFESVHPHYGRICLVLQIGWDVDAYEYQQCVRFETEFNGNCLFDWRKYEICGASYYYYADDDEASCELEYGASRTAEAGFSALEVLCATQDDDVIAHSWGDAKDAADFSNATIRVVAIP